MKFKCNNSDWEIQEVDEAIINNEIKNDYCLGITNYKKQVIMLLQGHKGIVKTLKHELAHVWLYEYGHTQIEENMYNYEQVCNILANSNDFINDIVRQYETYKTEIN